MGGVRSTTLLDVRGLAIPVTEHDVEHGEQLMNKPPVAHEASSAGIPNAQARELRDGPTPLAGNSHQAIHVLMFSDHRHSEARFSRPSVLHPSEIASHYPKEKLPVDRLLITRLFISALQRAGHDPSPEPAGFALERSVASGPVVLEGCIWKLHFETSPTPVLDLDLSLTLFALQPSTILWQADIPEVETLPFWIGLGCRPDEVVPAALADLEAAALIQFRSEQFLEAVEGRAVRKQAPSPDPGGSHKVVAATSWTTSEQGDITATAHESGIAASADAKSGKSGPSGAAETRTGRSQQLKKKQAAAVR